MNSAWMIILTSLCCVCNGCRFAMFCPGGNGVYEVACQGENKKMGAPNWLLTAELKPRWISLQWQEVSPAS
jgi:hypothetical protein